MKIILNAVCVLERDFSDEIKSHIMKIANKYIAHDMQKLHEYYVKRGKDARKRLQNKENEK